MKRKTLLTLSLLFALGMGLFTFVTFGYFADEGFRWGLEIPIGHNKGPLSTAADFIWTASPFLAILSALFALFWKGKRENNALLLLLALPPVLYTAAQILLAIDGKELPPSLWFTHLFLAALGILAAFSLFFPQGARPTAKLSLIYCMAEFFLLLLSLLFREKYSQFYLGGYVISDFYYFHVILSVFFYHLFYALSLATRLFALSPQASPNPDQQKKDEPEEEKSEESEEEDEEESPLSLEDFGIER